MEQFVDWISFGLKLTRLKHSANNLKLWINNYFVLFKNSSSLQSLKYISEFVCGSPADQNDLGRLFIELDQAATIIEETESSPINTMPILDHLMSQFNDHFDLSTAVKLLTEKPLPHFNACPILIHLLNSKPFLITMGRLRYFLFGNLAYYPSNQFTDQIIYNMGVYTRLLGNFRALIMLYSNELRPWLTNLLNNQTNLLKITNQLKYCQENKLDMIPSEIQEVCQYFLYALKQDTIEYKSIHLTWELILRICDLFISILRELLTDCFQIDQKFIAFNKRDEFDDYMLKNQNNLLSSPIGLIFDQLPNYFNETIDHHHHNPEMLLKKITHSPNILAVTLRKNPLYIYETNNYESTTQYTIPMPLRDPQKDMKYFTSGFIDVQEQLSRAFIQTTSEQLNATNVYHQLFNDIGIEMKMFPTGPYYFDAILMNIIFLLPQLMILSWVLSIILTVKYMIDEKDNRLVQFLRTFGINLSMNWLAWITISFSLMTMLSIVIVLILKYGKIIPLTDLSLIYFILLNYIISCLFYCILFTLLSVRSTIASIIAGITYFLLFIPAGVLLKYDELPSDVTLIPFCFIPQVSYSLSWIFINRLELQGVGAQWSNLWHTFHSHSILSLGSSIIFLWITTILFGLATFCGIPSLIKCYHLLMHKLESKNRNIFNYSTTMKKRKKRKISSGNQLDMNVNTTTTTTHLLENSFQSDRQKLLNSNVIISSVNNNHNNTDQSQPITIPPSVIVDNLCKKYQLSNRPALCNVDMNFYEDQITVILGRNGAGKTTLLSILVGILQPTYGKIIMHGQVMNQRLDILSKMLGYCPQYDILYDSLTVTEHIHLFGTLKGMSRLSINQKLDDYLCKLGLVDKRNEQTCRLSGGQRRKLSLFLAFLGNSSVILLDEPTASLDPFSRRAVWDLLKTLRKGRTIILSSHHMYESELLADRISIISEGKVLCSGSSLSLKSSYGSGYHLSLEIDSSTVNNSSSSNANKNDHFSELLQAIQIHISNARLLRQNLNKLTIYLPTCDVLTGKFTSLFKQLDEQEFQQLHHIKHYEIADSSLEEVFLSITGDAQTITTNSTNYEDISDYDDDHDHRQYGHIEFNHKSNKDTIQFTHNNYSNQQSRKKPSLLNMIKAMCYKRYIYLKRNKLSWIIEFIFPCLLIITGIGFLEYFKPNDIQPIMDINHWLMKSRHIDESVHFYANDMNLQSNEKQSFQSYTKIFNDPLSLTGVGCISPKLHSFQPQINANCLIQKNGHLNIDKSYYAKICKTYSSKNQFPCYPLATGDILLNLSDTDISDYLLSNSKLLYNIMFGGIELKTVEKSELNQMFYNLFSKLGNYSTILQKSNNWQQFLTDLRFILPPSKLIRLWYDNRGYISSVAYLNLLQNFQYRMVLSIGLNELSKQNKFIIDHNNVVYPTNSGIIITNHPLPYPDASEYAKNSVDIKADFLLSLFLILALSFIPASFISLPVYERNNNSKHLQNLSGLQPFIYWSINYIHDYATYLISSSLCILIIVIYGNSAYIQSDAIYPFILTIYLYGLAMVSLIYLASFLFKSSSTAFVLMCGLNLVIGSVTIFVRFFLEMLTFDSVNMKNTATATSTTTTTTTTAQIVSLWLHLSPHYCLSGSFYTIALRNFFHKIGIPYKANNSLWNLLQIDMGCLLLHSLILFMMVLLLEKRFYFIQIIYWKRNPFKWNRLAKSHNNNIHYTDLELNLQKKNEEHLSFKPPYAIEAKSVCKHYWSQKKPTVENLSLTIRSGECYGLLGVNGAGKSTTYSMLTGHCPLTHGSIYLNGYDITLNKEKACESIGYCPQQDALCEFMTPRELLTFYSYLRDHHQHQHHHHHHHEKKFNHTDYVNKMLELIGLQNYADYLITNLSGGNKRKLSTGIALIGNPTLIFLDEPSTGMDPQGKYLLWKNIQHALKLNCTILLSSHCMEECELLCNHIGLLIRGKIRCTGSPLELKQRYGLGYQVDLEFSTNVLQFTANTTNNNHNLEALLNDYLPGFKLRYPLLTRQEYHFAKTQPLWKLFNALENLNKYHFIQNVSIRQSTLEDVFVNFISMYEQNQLL
ncbi:unnamed protein product [Schistosoma turkestanicum]|nr:unnamed protein product [Schistosoma turkestanicum]